MVLDIVSSLGARILANPDLAVYLFNGGEYGLSPFIDQTERDYHPVKQAERIRDLSKKLLLDTQSDWPFNGLSAAVLKLRSPAVEMAAAYSDLLDVYAAIVKQSAAAPNPFFHASTNRNDIYREIFPNSADFIEHYARRFKARNNFFSVVRELEYAALEIGNVIPIDIPEIVQAKKSSGDCYAHMQKLATLRAEEIY